MPSDLPDVVRTALVDAYRDKTALPKTSPEVFDILAGAVVDALAAHRKGQAWADALAEAARVLLIASENAGVETWHLDELDRALSAYDAAQTHAALAAHVQQGEPDELDLIAHAKEWPIIGKLAFALRRQRDEIDTLQDDVLRFITQRNLVCERLAARIIPGPDGQDDIDRRRLIQEVSEEAWDDVDGWQEMAAKGATVIAERDRLARELAEARDAREVLATGRVWMVGRTPTDDGERWLLSVLVEDAHRGWNGPGDDIAKQWVVVLRATAEEDSSDG